MELELVGYWGGGEWPDVRRFVDPGWDSEEREVVGDYLRRGIVARAYLGSSPCQVCGRPNGSLELTDGVFLWPEGLAHYVDEHSVRLPDRVVGHVLRRACDLEEASVDSSWWREQVRP